MHHRLGYRSYAVLWKMLEYVQNLKVNCCSCYLDCVVCKIEKSCSAPVAKASDRVTTIPFQLCAADLIGPLPHSYGHARFALVIIDHCTRFTFCPQALSRLHLPQTSIASNCGMGEHYGGIFEIFVGFLLSEFFISTGWEMYSRRIWWDGGLYCNMCVSYSPLKDKTHSCYLTAVSTTLTLLKNLCRLYPHPA